MKNFSTLVILFSLSSLANATENDNPSESDCAQKKGLVKEVVETYPNLIRESTETLISAATRGGDATGKIIITVSRATFEKQLQALTAASKYRTLCNYDF